ncbi:hypothetical protein ACP70R_021096 [Stipagrostis hirtigluma subsp. patula]
MMTLSIEGGCISGVNRRMVIMMPLHIESLVIDSH